ncbi:MAG: thioredoxin family protein [Chlamydiales bacterium]|nr:thioredoxin family protein [Chlamydiales bacterium]
MRLLLLFIFLTLLSATYGWEADYSKALEKSSGDKKPLLLFFTGSDWSGLSMKMKNEVLDSDSFQQEIGSLFRCVEIDFPMHKTLASSTKKQNQELKKRFGIDEYPTLLILDFDERLIARMGFFPESGEQLAGELLLTLAQDGELCRGLRSLPRDEASLRRLYQLAQILMRDEACDSVLSAGIDLEIPFFLLERYRVFVGEGKNAAELREKLLKSEDYQVHFTLAMIDFQQLASSTHDAREVIKPLEAYLERFGDKDEQNVWRIEMMIAQFYLDTDEWGSALKHAETAYNNAPIGFRSEIENSMQYIKSQIR